MSTPSQAPKSIASPPPAFVCTSSKKLMENPTLSLCGHLFDQSVVSNQAHCPLDNKLLGTVIPLSDLKREIEIWKTHQLVAQQQKFPNPKERKSKEDQDPVEGIGRRFSTIPLPKNEPPAPISITPTSVCQKAHWDDIHGFVSTSQSTFVSCSKDNTLKMWNVNGTFRCKLNTDPTNTGYKFWGTALTSFSNDQWASGTRDGKITIWNQKGYSLKTLNYNPSDEEKSEYVCKDRNKARINCITQYQTNGSNLTFLTGTPRYVQLWDLNSSRQLQTYQASVNDWVYCIEVLDNQDLLVVIGSDLEHWQMGGHSPVKQSLIQETNRQHRAKQRPHISAITRLDHDRNQLASALFDGSVKINDIYSKNLVREYQEHKGRVWSVANLKPHILASSADDHTIKVWDVRQLPSCLTIGENPGRVSALLRLSEHILISGSCPDKVFESQEKASISFWDIRKIA